MTIANGLNRLEADAYTKDTHQAKIGPFEMSVNEKQTINVPVWAGIGAIVLGGGLLLVGRRKT